MGGFQSLRVRTRMHLLSFLTMLGLLALCLVSLAHLRDNLLEDRKQKTRNLVEVGVGILAHYHQLATAGAMPEADARKAAIETLRGLRYNKTDYYFVFDTNHVYYLYPTKPEFEGQNKKDLQDVRGKYLIQELVKAGQAGGGFVDYWFPKGGATVPEPKLSYAKLFEPWNWVIGTGIYIDDVDEEFKHGAATLGGISLALLLVIGFLAWRIAAGVLDQLGGEPRYAAAVTARIAAGDLTQGVSYESGSGDNMLQAVANMQQRLADLIRNIEHTADQLSLRSDELAGASAEVSRSAPPRPMPPPAQPPPWSRSRAASARSRPWRGTPRKARPAPSNSPRTACTASSRH
ncbi:MAG TPA: cache domain-containing protein [Rhodocyclaceae bacterium]